jgi:hypothetical protein
MATPAPLPRTFVAKYIHRRSFARHPYVASLYVPSCFSPHALPSACVRYWWALMSEQPLIKSPSGSHGLMGQRYRQRPGALVAAQ